MRAPFKLSSQLGQSKLYSDIFVDRMYETGQNAEFCSFVSLCL